MDRQIIPGIVLLLAFSSPARADLLPAKSRLDLGQIRTGPALTQVFELANGGSRTVTITAMAASCGCLQPRVESKTLAPGEKARLILDIRTLGQPAGAHTWSARIDYLDGNEVKNLAVQVHACLVTEIVVQPASLTLYTHGPLSQDITLADYRARPMKITAVATSSSRIKARLGSQSPAEPGKWRIHLDVMAGLEPGRHQEMITIYTSDPGYNPLQVPVTLMGASASQIFAMPDKVQLEAGRAPFQLLRLNSRDEKKVEIAEVISGDPAVSCRWAPGPGNQATLRIQLDPARWNGQALQTTVRVRIAGPDLQVLSIPVSCIER